MAVRYFDPVRANVITPYSDVSKLSTVEIKHGKLHRQIIHRLKALPGISAAVSGPSVTAEVVLNNAPFNLSVGAVARQEDGGGLQPPQFTTYSEMVGVDYPYAAAQAALKAIKKVISEMGYGPRGPTRSIKSAYNGYDDLYRVLQHIVKNLAQHEYENRAPLVMRVYRTNEPYEGIRVEFFGAGKTRLPGLLKAKQWFTCIDKPWQSSIAPIEARSQTNSRAGHAIGYFIFSEIEAIERGWRLPSDQHIRLGWREVDRGEGPQQNGHIVALHIPLEKIAELPSENRVGHFVDMPNLTSSSATSQNTITILRESAGFERLARVAGFTGLGSDIERKHIGDVAEIKHDIRVSRLAGKIAAHYGLDEKTAEFIGKVHNYNAIPFRHFAMSGELGRRLKEAGYVKGAQIIRLLKRDGFPLSESLENDLMNFDTGNNKALSGEAKAALAGDKVIGAVEDIMFGLKFDFYDFDSLSDEVLGTLKLTRSDKDRIMSGLNENFDDLVVSIAETALSAQDKDIDTAVITALSIKSVCRKFTSESIFKKSNTPEAIDRVNALIMPLYERFVKEYNGANPSGTPQAAALYAADRLASMTEDDVISTARSDVHHNQINHIDENDALFKDVLGEGKQETLVRVPVEAIESVGIDNIKNFLETFQSAQNGYVELFYMSGSFEVADSVYEKYGLYKKPFKTADGKDIKRTRENTITLFPAFKGDGDIDQSAILPRLGCVGISAKDTILSPIGLQHDPAGLIRATIFGLKVMDIARQVRDGKSIDKDAIHIDILNKLRDALDPSDFENFNLTPDDIIALASGDINHLIPALNKLIRLLPIAPINIEELRQIYEHAKAVIIAA